MDEWESSGPVRALRAAFLLAIMVASVLAFIVPSLLVEPVLDGPDSYIVAAVLMAFAVSSPFILWLVVFPEQAGRDDQAPDERAKIMLVLGLAFANGSAVYGPVSAILSDSPWIDIPFAGIALVEWAAIPSAIRHFMPDKIWRSTVQSRPVDSSW
jgi:hypothetical protein